MPNNIVSSLAGAIQTAALQAPVGTVLINIHTKVLGLPRWQLKTLWLARWEKSGKEESFFVELFFAQIFEKVFTLYMVCNNQSQDT